MKVLVGKFVLEANENVPNICDIENVVFDFNDKCLSAMMLQDVVNNSDVEVIPIFSANAGSNGVMTYNCFNYIILLNS